MVFDSNAPPFSDLDMLVPTCIGILILKNRDFIRKAIIKASMCKSLQNILFEQLTMQTFFYDKQSNLPAQLYRD